VPPSLATLSDKSAGTRQLGSRDQVRRLPHPGPARGRQGQAAHPQGLDWTRKSDHRRRVAKLPAETALIDGELVVSDEHGVSHFSMLQQALKTRQRFQHGLLRLRLMPSQRYRSAPLPLTARKAALANLLPQSRRHRSGPFE